MKTTLLFLILMVLPSVAGAVTFNWDAVTVGVDGALLENGAEVSEYRIYRCGSNVCDKITGVLFATVPSAATSYVVSSEQLPQLAPATYFVTAVNVAGESVESNRVRVVPPDLPKNFKFSR